MSKEIAKVPSWEERQRIATKRVQELLDGNTAEDHLKASEQAAKDADEYADLQAWFTDTYDAYVLGSSETVDTRIASFARQSCRQTDPEKWKRMRELEKRVSVGNAKHASLAAGAHASIVEQNLRTRHLY